MVNLSLLKSLGVELDDRGCVGTEVINPPQLFFLWTWEPKVIRFLDQTSLASMLSPPCPCAMGLCSETTQKGAATWEVGGQDGCPGFPQLREGVEIHCTTALLAKGLSHFALRGPVPSRHRATRSPWDYSCSPRDSPSDCRDSGLPAKDQTRPL